MTTLTKEERALSVYQMCLYVGAFPYVDGDTIRFDKEDRVTPVLRRQVEANKTSLIEHLRSLPQ